MPTRGGNGMAANPLLWLISTLIWLYIYVLIAAAVLSWLIAFNIVNTRNQFVAMIGDFLYRVTEPALRPIRSVMPDLGGIDISPIILIVGLLFLERVLYWALA
jgi:YggT family protein